MITHTTLFKKSAVFLALSSTLSLPNYAIAAEDKVSIEGIERIQITTNHLNIYL